MKIVNNRVIRGKPNKNAITSKCPECYSKVWVFVSNKTGLVKRTPIFTERYVALLLKNQFLKTNPRPEEDEDEELVLHILPKNR